ncbi:MAG: hypothetical protein AAGG02_03720 [Cyanobacteria bacterium P01_H01_bin.15]
MKSIDQQLQQLSEEAPQHGLSSAVVAVGVAPVLRRIAASLQQPAYFLSTNPNGDWLVTEIAHRQNPQQQRRVIYGFATLEDAAQFTQNQPDQMDAIAKSIPIIELLFSVFAQKDIDALILFQQPGDLIYGTEIKQAHLQAQIMEQLKLLQTKTPPSSSQLA